MKKVLITTQEFMDQYSVSRANFHYLVRTRELIPFRWGLQTFLAINDVELSASNMQMMAEMAAGMHRPSNSKRKI